MYPIIVAALNGLLGFVFRAALIKFVVFTALLAIVVGFMPLIASLLPDAVSLAPAFNAIPASVWFFLDMFKVGFGLQAMATAYGTRFIIRRLPVVG